MWMCTALRCPNVINALSGSTPASRQYAPDATPRIWYIPRITRYQVHVNMHARLACGFPDIYANVVAVGRMLLLNRLLNLSQQGKDRRLFLRGHVEKAGHMALWNDEHVSAAQ